jgi:hypothetical protein
MWTSLEDGSVIDDAGKYIFFSPQRFLKDLCLGEYCFICGASPSLKQFSDEHVLPDWVLRRFTLHERAIELPNGNSIKYGRYTIPCCLDCNQELGGVFEQHAARMLEGGYPVFSRRFNKAWGHLLFQWIALIFLKTHFRDRLHRFHLDARKGTEAIAEGYDWDSFHYLHTMIRSFHSGCIVDDTSLGSFIALPVKHSGMTTERFDFADLYFAQTAMIRLEDIALIAVFNDCGIVSNYLQPMLNRISGPVSEIQLRELMVTFAYENLMLNPRSQHHCAISLESKECKLYATRKEPTDRQSDLLLRGKLLYNALASTLPLLELRGSSREGTIRAIEEGKLTFLFDDDGHFISNSIFKLDRSESEK